MSLFSAADACLSWSFPSITEQQVCPHRLPMKYWLKNHLPDQALFKHSLHTNCLSNSAILHNKYISLLSDLCACVQMKKNGVAKEAIHLQRAVQTASWDFKPGKKVMGWCTAQWKILLFCVKTIVKVMQISSEEEEERKTFWPSGNFLVRYFCDAL